jgi:hypothetical protein
MDVNMMIIEKVSETKIPKAYDWMGLSIGCIRRRSGISFNGLMAHPIG